MAKEIDAPPLLDPLIHSIRGQRVILDADLARLYGVTTRRFNEGFRRNRDRFPDDFAFQLTIAEFAAVRFRPAPSDLQPADLQRNIQNRSQIATGSQKHRDPRFRPWVFSEHGALMAANVMRSKHAVHMSVFVIRAFVRLREELAANSAILKRLAEIDRTLLQHDSALRDIYRKLLPLLQPPPDPPRRGIGFQASHE
jgi:hypothetical protein